MFVLKEANIVYVLFIHSSHEVSIDLRAAMSRCGVNHRMWHAQVYRYPPRVCTRAARTAADALCEPEERSSTFHGAALL